MSLFDRLVSDAVKGIPGIAPLRMVVEKELLHHDIVREMSSAGLLSGLTFIGGTCLRACYGSSRLSEDLDFTGGADFTSEKLSALGMVLVQRFKLKYGLNVDVSEPVRESGNVATWKLRITTRPGKRNLPAQRINIDICAIPSHDSRPMLLRNPYSVDMGTAGLIIHAESREEIFADKIVALALRPNRIKNRDIWDIGWLRQQGIIVPLSLIPIKLQDHNCEPEHFLDLLTTRQYTLENDPALFEVFRQEMRRFLPAHIVVETIDHHDFWRYLVGAVSDECRRVKAYLTGGADGAKFIM